MHDSPVCVNDAVGVGQPVDTHSRSVVFSAPQAFATVNRTKCGPHAGNVYVGFCSVLVLNSVVPSWSKNSQVHATTISPSPPEDVSVKPIVLLIAIFFFFPPICYIHDSPECVKDAVGEGQSATCVNLKGISILSESSHVIPSGDDVYFPPYVSLLHSEPQSVET